MADSIYKLAKSAEQSAMAEEQLNNQAEDLRRIVAPFRLKGNIIMLDIAKSDHEHYINSLKAIVQGINPPRPEKLPTIKIANFANGTTQREKQNTAV